MESMNTLNLTIDIYAILREPAHLAIIESDRHQSNAIAQP